MNDLEGDMDTYLHAGTVLGSPAELDQLLQRLGAFGCIAAEKSLSEMCDGKEE